MKGQVTGCVLLVAVLAASCTPTAGAPPPSPGPAAGSRTDFVVPGSLYAVRASDVWRFSGTAVRQITRTGDAFDPAISPDGRRLAYIRRGRSTSELWLADADGRNAQAAATAATARRRDVWVLRPAWSPDGQSIALTTDRDRLPHRDPPDPSLWLFVPGSGSFRRLSSAAGYAGGDTDAAWSPAGESLIYTAYLYEPEPALRLSARLTYCQLRGRCDLFLSPPGERMFHPAWSPDGKWVAFVRASAEGDDLYLMPAPSPQDAVGREPFPTARATLAVRGVVAQPTWSPDGSYLAYAALGPRGFDLMVMPVATAPTLQVGTPVALTRGASIAAASRLSWGP